MSAVDYTPVILAQLTDLQMRVTKQDAMITALRAEVERLSGKGPIMTAMPTGMAQPTGPIMNTSIPLRPSSNLPPITQNRYEKRDMRDTYNKYEKKGAQKTAGDKPSTIPMTLSDVVHKDEIVTIQVGTGKDSGGKFTHTTAKAVFDGTDLCVESCELAPSLVGLKSSKPGEILYKFIDALKETGHIQRTFTIAPWKLCFVERSGVRKSLEELRSVVG
jgi:hypothetical protein